MSIATKDQERAALEKIRKIVEGLGQDSYLGTAFRGVFEDAQQNIEDDAAFSQYDRAESAIQRAEAAEARLKELVGVINNLKAERNSLEIKLAKQIFPNDLYQGLWLFVTNEAEASRDRMKSLADVMADLADAPQDIAFKHAVENYRKEKARAESCEKMASGLDAIEPEGV